MPYPPYTIPVLCLFTRKNESNLTRSIKIFHTNNKTFYYMISFIIVYPVNDYKVKLTLQFFIVFDSKFGKF